MADVTLGDRELDVLDALWRGGAGTVAEVQGRLDVDLAYNTVLTVLRNLETKGVVGHTVEGRFHRYHAVVAESSMRGSMLDRFVGKLFGGSALSLMAHLVESEQVSRAELAELRRLIDERVTADVQDAAEGDATPTRKSARNRDRRT